MNDDIPHILKTGITPIGIAFAVLCMPLIGLPLLTGRPLLPQTGMIFTAVSLGGLGVIFAVHNQLCGCKKMIPWSTHVGWGCIVVALLFAAFTPH
jgi:hypothetical protein